MDDYTRENMVGWGEAVAAWAVIRNSDGLGSSVINSGLVLGAIEHEHTRYVVTRNTGDERLGRRAGLGAARRTAGWWLAAFAAPVVLFVGMIAITMPMGLSEDTTATIGPVTLLACFVLFILLAVKAARGAQRNAYTRANLPSEDEMNRSGYYQVEPDLWFNSITNNVLTGHAYDGVEIAASNAAYRNEDRQIRDLYRQQRRLRP